jgi:signal transduction histidine kinase
MFWVPLVIGTFAAGVGAGYFGSLQRRNAAEQHSLALLGSMIRVEQGVAESLRKLLSELCRMFSCQEAIIVVRDDELERLFVYRVKQGDTGRITPASLPFEKADAFLLDQPDASVAWNDLSGSGAGFAWNRHTGRPLASVPRMPGPSIKEFGVRSLLAVVIEHSGIATGRLLLLNGERDFAKDELAWLERIARSLAPALENLYTMRHLRAKAIESERTRFAHDLHDGILQTMLSFNIQLDVLRRKVLQSPDRVAADLAALQQTLKHESDELRRIVTDLRPLRVESADLVDLMRGFADRFRSESGVPLDLIADSMNLQIPDRICRELFQIYREALHNIKKHANASHVVVKLWQDEEKATLVVDDNGQGFSFAGRFSSDELDRLRLGPISIKERTRSIGGNLTVESNPGHGARITVEVPIS